MLGIDYKQMKELEDDARQEDSKNCDTCGSDENKGKGGQCLTCGGPLDVILPAKFKSVDLGTIKACSGCQEYYTYQHMSLEVLPYDRTGGLWCFDCIKEAV